MRPSGSTQRPPAGLWERVLGTSTASPAGGRFGVGPLGHLEAYLAAESDVGAGTGERGRTLVAQRALLRLTDVAIQGRVAVEDRIGQRLRQRFALPFQESDRRWHDSSFPFTGPANLRADLGVRRS
jgi:hypothetical protein